MNNTMNTPQHMPQNPSMLKTLYFSQSINLRDTPHARVVDSAHSKMSLRNLNPNSFSE